MNIDLNRITIAEYRALLDPKQPQDEEDVIIAKACGITVDELLALPYPEYRRMVKAFFAAASAPLDSPN